MPLTKIDPNTCAVAPQTQVQSALERLAERVIATQGLVEGLEERLAPVLREEQDKLAADPVPPEQVVPLSAAIARIADTADHAASRLSSIIERLEL